LTLASPQRYGSATMTVIDARPTMRRAHALVVSVLFLLVASSTHAASLAKQCKRDCKDETRICREGCTGDTPALRRKCRKSCKRNLIARCKTEGLQACDGSGDPCTGAASCDRRTLGEDDVVTASTDTGYRTVIHGAAGTAEIVWTVSGASTSFQYRPPGGSPGPVVTLAGTPADAAGVTDAAMLLHLSRTITAGTTASYTGPNPLSNTSVCDQLHELDCGPIGKCCDVHDDCITTHCGGQGECGNVLGAMEAAYGPAPCSADCLECHGRVVKCFFDGSHPGPSDCCEDGDCGRSQECMIDGRVITDPCVCKSQGIASVTECPPQTCGECTPNFSGCLPDGSVSQSSRCCCSCKLRIPGGSIPNHCACQKDCCLDMPGCAPAGTGVNHYSACCSCSVSGSGPSGTCE
jgi:hypothetical protein